MPNSGELLTSPRFQLRRWRDEDREPFAVMNADPAVMEFFPQTWAREQSDASVDRIQKHWVEHGFGIWVLEVDSVFAGTLGLQRVPFEAAFTPAVELGYRLLPRWWNQGLATEASAAALRYGFEQAGLHEIVAFTAAINLRSRRVMEKLGMHYAEEFDHPLLAQGHRLRRHVLYRLPWKPPQAA